MNTENIETRAVETAQALAALFLILFFSSGRVAVFIYLALGVLILSLVTKVPFKPISRLWFGLGEIMGTLVSKAVLTVVYYLLLTPLSLIYRTFHRNPLYIKRTQGTLFVDKDHGFSAEDFINPY